MYLYQKTNRYFAQAADDIKDLAEDELLCLGAVQTHPAYRGVYFQADPASLYRINLQSRLINRVLAPLVAFDCPSDTVLYREASTIRWQDFLELTDTFSIFATVNHSTIRHSKFAALRLKDAIADTFRKRTGKRPSVDTRSPDLWLNLYIDNDKATISLDTSGGSLHRRGYRRETVEAPMMETLAASIIQISEWDGSTPLIDPFCGSGTLLCEAYLKASGTPPAVLRERFGFQRLPDFKDSLWQAVQREATSAIRPVPRRLIRGSDVSSRAIQAAIQNCGQIDPQKCIRVLQQDIFDIEQIQQETIVCNPPYGIRMGKEMDLDDFYRRFGDFLKQRCTGTTAYIYFGDRQWIKKIGLKPSWKKPLANGGLDGRLVKYDLY